MLICLDRNRVRPAAPRTIDRAVAAMNACADEDSCEPLPTSVMASIAAGNQLPPHRTMLRDWSKGGVSFDHFDLFDEIDEALRHGRAIDTDRLIALRASIAALVESAWEDEYEEGLEAEWFHAENEGRPRRHPSILV